MAKVLKFGLMLDDCNVRSLKGLQEHFVIEDVLKYFEDGTLSRWLKVWGYKEQLAAVEAIDKTLDKKDIVLQLANIFGIEDVDAADIEKAVSIIAYLEEEKELNTIYAENNFAKRQIIDNYHLGYLALVNHMMKNKDNMAILKADAMQMERNYLGLFQLDNVRLFYFLLNIAPKAIFAILTRDELRKFWIGQIVQNGYDQQQYLQIYSFIKDKLLVPGDVVRILGKDAKFADKDTQGMWDYLESSKVKVMVIYVWDGTFVKNEGGDPREKISPSDINGKLTKFNGLEYRCNNDSSFYLSDSNGSLVCDSCGGSMSLFGNCEKCGHRERVSYKVLYMEV